MHGIVAGGARPIPAPRIHPPASRAAFRPTGDHIVKNADGTIYEDRVRPAAAERNPGAERLPRLRQAGRPRVVGRLYRSLTKLGVAIDRREIELR